MNVSELHTPKIQFACHFCYNNSPAETVFFTRLGIEMDRNYRLGFLFYKNTIYGKRGAKAILQCLGNSP